MFRKITKNGRTYSTDIAAWVVIKTKKIAFPICFMLSPKNFQAHDPASSAKVEYLFQENGEYPVQSFLNKLRLIFALLLFPFRAVLNRLGIDPDIAGNVNSCYREEFTRISPSEKAVILPHCLTGDNCRAHFSKNEGVLCMKCGNCRCGEILALCKENGWQFYISPSTNFTKRLVERKDLRAAIGAACDYEIERGIKSTRITGRGVHLKKRRLIPQVIVAARYDCLHNDIDWEGLRNMILSERDCA